MDFQKLRDDMKANSIKGYTSNPNPDLRELKKAAMDIKQREIDIIIDILEEYDRRKQEEK